ncbi:MAG: ATP-binding cassette domain-containing protein [Thermoleophilia bacterium]|nr:ATP-binding cassette domain-containing protein [Thermoleophilia bacterium]
MRVGVALDRGPAVAGPGVGGGGASAASVTVRGLRAGYSGRQGEVLVLAGLDLALAPGERLAVVGESGCGKSTLLHVLAGLHPPSAGEVLVDGRVVATAGDAHSGGSSCSAGHAASMFQRDLLLPWKPVLGNTVFAARVAGTVAVAAAGGVAPGPRGPKLRATRGPSWRNLDWAGSWGLSPGSFRGACASGSPWPGPWC